MPLLMNQVRQMVQRFAHSLGYTIVPSAMAGVSARLSMEGALTNMKNTGFVPGFVIDVGAAYGDFTRTCLRLFPDSSYLLLEPLEEYGGDLDLLVREHPKSTVIKAAAAAHQGVRNINIHPDLVGSSFLLEPEEESDVNGTQREVAVTTIDAEVKSVAADGPVLLKVDVQGAELDVLAGASKTVESSEVLILETTLFNTFENGPVFHEVVAYMADRDFCVYDIIGNLYRPLDGALIQVDVIFVKRSGVLRRCHAYATAEQRMAQTEMFSRRAKTLIRTKND